MTKMATSTTAPTVDGRRLRSARSHERIVDALLDLVSAGNVSPSSEEVAEKAGVGLRTVFRHFKNMESLYREMSELVSEQIQPLIEDPFESLDWRGRFAELLDRKVELFEEGRMFYLASRVHRYESTFMLAEHQHNVAGERKALTKVLPNHVKRDRELIDALELVLSFDSWIRLRQDQGLSIRRSKDTIRRLVKAVLLDL